MWCWQKTVPEHQIEAWQNTLNNPALVILTHPPATTATLQLYSNHKTPLLKLHRLHKGKLTHLKKSDWLKPDTFHLPLPPHICIASSIKVIPKKYRSLKPIIIPGGIAFGTGQHATTQMCLRQLIKHIHKNPTPTTLLDIGTGTGIFALTAAALGFHVTALDNDPDAIREARANATRNHTIPPIQWKCSPIQSFKTRKTFPLILANLYAELLIHSAPQITSLLSPNGTLILSGILKTQHPTVLKTFKKQSLTLRSQHFTGKWTCCVLQKPTP